MTSDSLLRKSRRWPSGLTAAVLALCPAVSTFGQAQQQIVIQDPAQLVGKRINVQRLPLCEPGTYKPDIVHAGMQATVISAKPSNIPALSQSVLNQLQPPMRDLMLDQQKAALLLLQFDDGVKRDTCVAIGPKKLAEYIDLAPGQTLGTAAVVVEPAGGASPQQSVQSIDELTDEEVKSALSGDGGDHWVRIEDQGLMAAQGSQVPSITLFLPEAILYLKNDSAKKQFLKFEPTEEDRQRALTVVAEGYVAKEVLGGCQSVTRIILLSDPAGTFFDREYVIAILERNDHPPQPQPAVSNTYHYSNSNVVHNSPGSAITQTIGIRDQELGEIVAQLSESLKTARLSEDDRERLGTEIGTLEVQAKSRQPNRSVLKESLVSVKHTMEHAAGHVLGAAIITLINAYGVTHGIHLG